MLNKIKNFFSEARQELRHVNWPTRAESTRLTGIVIGISLGLALFLGLFDLLFADIIKRIVFEKTAGQSAVVTTPEIITTSTTTADNASATEALP